MGGGTLFRHGLSILQLYLSFSKHPRCTEHERLVHPAAHNFRIDLRLVGRVICVTGGTHFLCNGLAPSARGCRGWVGGSLCFFVCRVLALAEGDDTVQFVVNTCIQLTISRQQEQRNTSTKCEYDVEYSICSRKLTSTFVCLFPSRIRHIVKSSGSQETNSN
jgi:hypothetical protein